MNHSSGLILGPRAAGWLLFAAATLAGGGCVSSYRFAIDAVRHPVAAPERAAYVLVNQTLPGAGTELAFAAVAQDVRTALSSKGLFEAPAGVTPEFEVEVDFGLEGPEQKTVTHREPVYVLAAPGRGALGNGSVGDLRAAGQMRQIGERTVTSVIIVYRKFLRLTARLARKGADEPPGSVLWSVVVTNDDGSEDLSRYVRLMAAAAMDVIDADTGAERKIVLTDRDGRVVFIEQGV